MRLFDLQRYWIILSNVREIVNEIKYLESLGITLGIFEEDTFFDCHIPETAFVELEKFRMVRFLWGIDGGAIGPPPPDSLRDETKT